MMTTRPSKRPKVADVKTWDVEYENTIYADWRGRTIWVRVENGYPFPDFYRITYTIDGIRKSKLFYGESAWMQVNRMVHDLGFWDWSL
jgi:hypothetical protein